MSAERATVARHLRVMGTVASIHVYDRVERTVIEPAVESVVAELERLEQMFSTYRATSEISRCNAGELSLHDCSPEVIDVLDACTWLEHASSGAFHVRRDGCIDPAGFVKGWAAERASERLAEHGLEHWSVNVGGDLLVHGSPGADVPWTIAIADPTTPGRAITMLPITSGAVATSGTAERGRHVWDAADQPADAFASVTVLGPTLTWADAFATTAFALGPAGIEWVSQFDGYRAFAVTHAGELINTVPAA
jgi:thiamine biosynthesis lipoprotein